MKRNKKWNRNLVKRKPNLVGCYLLSTFRRQFLIIAKVSSIFRLRKQSSDFCKVTISLNLFVSSASASKKTMRCGKCENCTRRNCGQCKYCLDMKCFGGPNLKRQSCVLRRCVDIANNKVNISFSFASTITFAFTLLKHSWFYLTVYYPTPWTIWRFKICSSKQSF